MRSPRRRAGSRASRPGLLIVVATGLSVEIKSLLIGESASPKTRRAIRRFFEAHRHVLAIRSLITLQQQGDEILVAVQLEMQPLLTGARLLRAITECKTDFQAQFPQAKWIFLEPVADDEDGATRTAGLSSPRPRRTRRRRTRSAHA